MIGRCLVSWCTVLFDNRVDGQDPVTTRCVIPIGARILVKYSQICRLYIESIYSYYVALGERSATNLGSDIFLNQKQPQDLKKFTSYVQDN